MKDRIVISEYSPDLQTGINQMMLSIQEEYREAITTKHSTIISDVYQLPGQKYWVATFGEEIAGTIGIVLYSKNSAVVKRMMVGKRFRGSTFGTAKKLLDLAFSWAKKQGAKTVYLGTMAQFIAAQKFYEKCGFKKIPVTELPKDYSVNPMDTIFYKLELQAK